MGKGRTTTGMILACLVKDILFGDSSKTYYSDSDLVNPKDFSDEDEAVEEVCRSLTHDNDWKCEAWNVEKPVKRLVS